MSVVLEARNLVKHFVSPGSRRKSKEVVRAVDGVSFEISGGTCFGFLGPNGAGKTTTVEMLEGIVTPTDGEILYRGNKLNEQIADQYRQSMGIMFQHTALQDHMTVREALTMFKSFYQTSVDEALLIEQCALEEFLGRDTRKLSGGQKQRLLLAIALVNDPDVVFLDEPTTGLDPQARRNFWQLVDSIKSRGKTVVLTTHYMEEASLLCDQLIFMDHGKIIAAGKPRELLSERFNDVILELPVENWQGMEITRGDASSGKSPSEHEPPKGQEVIPGKTNVEIRTPDIDETLVWLQAGGISVSGLTVRERSLEDLFIELTGKELRT